MSGKYTVTCDLCKRTIDTDLLIIKRLGLCYECARKLFPKLDLLVEVKK